MGEDALKINWQSHRGTGSHLVWKLTIVTAFAVYAAAALQFPMQEQPDPARGIFDKSLTADQIAAATEKLTSAERDGIRAKETDRLIQEPLDRTALRNITLLTVLEKGVNADALALESAKRSLRDPQNQLMAVQSLIKKEQFAESLDRLDGLLRAKPYLANGVFPTILTIAKNSKAATALTALLKTEPPWRRPFLQYVLGSPGGFQQVYQILGQLRSAGETLHIEDLRATLKSAIGAKVFDVAYFIWLDFLDETELRRVGPIYDGGFDLPSRNLFFDWTLAPQKNVKLAIINRPEGANNGALSLDFYGYSGAFAQVSQILRLAPGRYSSNFETIGKNFVSEGGLQLQIGCVETGVELGRSDAIHETRNWTKMTFEFYVPDQNCSTQLLRIGSASRAKLDNKMSGRILFDNLTIEFAIGPPIQQ